jgi:hypothetical protein
MRFETVRNFPRDTSGLTLLGLNLVAAVIGYFVSLGVFQLDNEVLVDPKYEKFCSLIVAMLTFVIVYIWEYGRKTKFEFSGFAERLRSLENKNQSIERVGSALNLLDERYDDIMKAAARATSVRNTLIFYHAENPTSIEASLKEYLHKGARKRYRLIARVVQGRHEWTELFSQNVSRSLNKHIQATKAASAAFYRPYVMRKGWPVVNFVLFSGSEPEVWFGFGLFGDHVDGDVFRSRDPKLFTYFERYFEELKGGCVAWTGVEQQSFQGTWITVVYTQTRIKDCAAVVISTRNNAPYIYGDIFPFGEQGQRFERLNSFISRNTKCVLDDDAVKLEFDCINDNNVPPNRREVRCCYEIRDFQSPDSFAGAVRAGGPNPIAVYGCKLNQATAVRIAAFTHAEMENYLTGLVNAGNIKRHPPLGNQSPFFGTMFA